MVVRRGSLSRSNPLSPWELTNHLIYNADESEERKRGIMLNPDRESMGQFKNSRAR